MFRKMPVLLVLMIILLGVLHTFIPLGVKEFLYSISLFLKSIILFFMPALIFALLFKAAAQFSRQASVFIIGTLVAICLSNFTSTSISSLIGTIAYKMDLSLSMAPQSQALPPLWTFSLPKWLGNAPSMLAGFLSGVILGRYKPQWSQKISSIMEKMIHYALKVMIFIIPLFIAGFVIKMYHDEVMLYILKHFGQIFLLIFVSLIAYNFILYLVIHRFQFRKALHSLQNMFPAAIAGFGSMSSAAAMPLTILGAEKNADYPDLAKSLVPITVNVHLIGDCFAIPIFAFAILKSFGMPDPAFGHYLLFLLFFVIAKFSVAAVPGGGILVMLPILEKYLGFTPMMLSLITTLYIIFDPVITAANIVGNGGFSIGVSTLLKKSFLKENIPQPQKAKI